MLLHSDMNLNPGPTSSKDFQSFWKRFENYWLRFLYSKVNNILPKLDALKTTAGNTKAAVISIIESKIDNSVSTDEIGIPCYCVLRYDRKRYMGQELHVISGRSYISLNQKYL